MEAMQLRFYHCHSMSLSEAYFKSLFQHHNCHRKQMPKVKKKYVLSLMLFGIDIVSCVFLSPQTYARRMGRWR